MSSVNRTYFLSPAWTYPPGGPIALGNIIVDPFRPYQALTTPTSPLSLPLTRVNVTAASATSSAPSSVSSTGFSPPSTAPSVGTLVPAPSAAVPQQPLTLSAVQNDWDLSTPTEHTANFGIWAAFTGSVPLGTGIRRVRVKDCHYTTESVETQYYAEDPSAEYIALRCTDPLVQKFMQNDNVLLRKPVYMITGVKIARGFVLTENQTGETGLGVRAGGTVAPVMNIGGIAELGSRNTVTHSFRSADDIVLAYQLMKISVRGWWWPSKKTTLRVAEHHHSAAFLSCHDDHDCEEFGVEYGPLASVEHVEGMAHGQHVVQVMEEGHDGPVSLTILFKA